LSNVGSTAAGRYGAAGAAQVTLQEAQIAVAWNLQGDPAKPAFADAARAWLGTPLPVASNTVAATGHLTIAWLGPTSWLLIAGGTLAPSHPLTSFNAKRDAINAAGGALFDVSTSRVAWTVGGARAATVLASGCPLDLHARAFAPGSCAQSLFSHVNALILRRANGDFTLLVARSLGRNTWHTLCGASAQYGYEVLAPTAFG
jgi:sarcosine oxidase subunit gamma